MNRVLLLAALVLLSWQCNFALAQKAPPKSLSIKDLGLGMPKKPETPFEPGWWVEGGVVLLQRSGSSSVVLANTDVPASGDTLDAADLGFGFEWGPYISLSTRVFDLVKAEVLYYGVYDWRATSSAENVGGISTGVFDAGAVVFDQIDVRYTSRIDNVEINTLYPLLGKLEWLVGFRWLQLDEYSTTLWDGRTSGTDYASATASAKNGLYGVQMGIDGTLWQPSSRLSLDGMVKICLFNNAMSTRRNVAGTIDAFSPYGRSVTRTSFLAELGLMGRFALTQNFLLGAGYQVMWIDGVATGFSAVGGQEVNSVLFHGLRATVEARW